TARLGFQTRESCTTSQDPAMMNCTRVTSQEPRDDAPDASADTCGPPPGDPPGPARSRGANDAERTGKVPVVSPGLGPSVLVSGATDLLEGGFTHPQRDSQARLRLQSDRCGHN